jgi:hypothetical protein
MTRAQANAMLKAWGKAHGLSGTFNANGLASVTVGTTPLVFEWSEAKKAVLARALVYRFQQPATPAVLDKVKAAGLDYVSESRALCVTKAFDAPLEPALLDAQLETLVATGLSWATEGLDRLFS